MRPSSPIGIAHHPTAEGHPRPYRGGPPKSSIEDDGASSAAVGTPGVPVASGCRGVDLFLWGRHALTRQPPAADLA